MHHYHRTLQLMVPDDVGPNLDRFLDPHQLQFVDNLRIVMTLFWLPKPLGDLEEAYDDCAPLQILQRVLDKLSEAKAGRSGPLLRSLQLEALSDWRPGGRTRIGRERACLDIYKQMARDAGVETLRVELSSGWSITTITPFSPVEDGVPVNGGNMDA